MHTVAKGDLSVAMLMAKFLRQQFVVLKPITELLRYDLVIDRARTGIFERVQCKTGRLRNGAVVFNTCSSMSHHGPKYGKRDYIGQIEFFGVYCPDNDSCYLVPVDKVPTRMGILRVEQSKNNQKAGVIWASDFLL